MGWNDVKKGSGSFVVMAEDGDNVTGVPVGEPDLHLVKTKDGKQRKRYYINFWQPGQEKCSILPMNVTLADNLKTALNAEDEKKSLVGRAAVTITRRGRKGDLGTKYEVAVKKLSPAEVKAAAKAEQVDLSNIEDGDSKF